MTDYAAARHNMIESQVRPNGITDGRVILAMAEIPRERFVPEGARDLAYMDEDVSLADGTSGQGRVLIEPMAFARLLQLAAVSAGDFVLDIGCATGYSAAVLARLGDSVVAIDEDAEMCERATANLQALDINNIAVLELAHAAGCPAQAPYDAIVIEGMIPCVPEGLLTQLKDGGRLVAVVGNDTIARAQLWTRHGDTFANRDAFNATVGHLPGIDVERPAFSF